MLKDINKNVPDAATALKSPCHRETWHFISTASSSEAAKTLILNNKDKVEL